MLITKTKSRMLLLLLSLVLIIISGLLFPRNAKAYSATYGGVTWSYGIVDAVKKTGYISTMPTTISGAVTIPTSLNGYYIVKIGDSAFANCTNITSVTIPSNITAVGNSAFSGCTRLTTVNINDSVTSLGSSVFSGCTKLSNITLSNSLTEIPESAFYNCTYLKSIALPDSITKLNQYAFRSSGLTSFNITKNLKDMTCLAFHDCNSLSTFTVDEDNQFYSTIDGNIYLKDGETLFLYAKGKTNSAYSIPEGTKKINDNAFLYNTRLTSITIPEGIESIGDYAFLASNITSINLPEGLLSIGAGAFYNCTNLSSITIPHSLRDIGNNAFYNTPYLAGTGNALIIEDMYVKCNSNNLSSITIPEGITIIGDGAFAGLTNLTTVTIPSSVTTIGDYAFNGCTALTNINLPNNLTLIDKYAFSACTNLTNFTLPNNISSISDGCFVGCTSLTEVILPDSVTSIGNSAFARCSNLASITIPDSVTSIGNNAFSSCSNLASITIPDSVTSIGNSAFSSCIALTSVVIPNSVSSLGQRAFYNCTKLSTIELSDNINTIQDSTFYQCSALTSINLSNNIKQIERQAFAFSGLQTIIIPEGVETIGIIDYDDANQYNYGAFCYCKQLTSISFPSTLKTIGNGTCFNSALRTVSFQNGIEEIGHSAFGSCTNLQSIIIPNSVTKIGAATFGRCTALTSAKLSDNLKTLPMGIFSECSNLTSLVVPSSVETIEYRACCYCTKLANLTIYNTTETIDATMLDYAKVTTMYVVQGSSAHSAANSWKSQAKVTNISFISPAYVIQTSINASNGLYLEETVNIVATVLGGTTPYSYQWYKDEEVLEGENTSTYSIESLSVENAGSYTCKVSDATGQELTSKSILLRVNNYTRPKISIPTEILYDIYDDITIEPIVTGGTAPYSYRWQKNSTDISGATEASLIIKDATEDATGKYRCIIKDANNVTTYSSEITVSVRPSPTPIMTLLKPVIILTRDNGPFVIHGEIKGGVAPYTYMWIKDNTIVENENPYDPYDLFRNGNDTAPTGYYYGHYWCIVTDAKGQQYTSNMVVVAASGYTGLTLRSNATKGLVKVMFDGTPKSLTLNSGVTGGKGPYTYKWKRNGEVIQEAITETLVISNVTKNDLGKYSVDITDAEGVVITNSFVVKGEGDIDGEPLSIVSQPIGGNKIVGQNHTFSFGVEKGTGVLSYQWHKGEDAILSANSETYTISSLTTEDTGNYHCVVTDENSKSLTSNEATLSVFEALAITKQPIDIVTILDETINFTIEASGGAGAISYQWYKNNEIIEGATNSTYSIASTKATDVGEYHCIATCSILGTATSNVVTLTVNRPPVIVSEPESKNLNRGDNTELSVLTDGGIGALSYQWYKDKVPVTETPSPVQQMMVSVPQMEVSFLSVSRTEPMFRFVSDDPTTVIEGANSPTLRLNGIDVPNAGDYYCVVTDEAGNTISSRNAIISVATGETLTAENPIGAVESLVGQEVTLTADTEGGTAPYDYQWQKDGEDIPGATDKTYTIPSVTPTDAGNYTCEVTDYTGTTIITNTALLSVSAQIDPTNNDGSSDGTMIIGVIQPIQIKAVVPTVITFHVDPNEPANYTSTPGGALTAPSFSFQNACNAPLSFGLSNISAQAGNPAVVSASAFTDEEWQNLTISETTNNIAFGIVGDDQSQWQTIDSFDAWYELTPVFFGDLQGHASADLHLKAKYGLAWGNTTEQTITYDVVYIVAVAE